MSENGINDVRNLRRMSILSRQLGLVEGFLLGLVSGGELGPLMERKAREVLKDVKDLDLEKEKGNGR